MRHRIWRSIGLVAFAFSGSGWAFAQTCTALESLVWERGQIDEIEAVPAGAFELTGGRGGPRTITDLPAFCRVRATLSPEPESAIGVEVWLPDPGVWNGRYLAVGNGAFAGSIPTNGMIDPLRNGYAVSSTDTGHEGGSGEFALVEAKMVDFAYRAVHEMAVFSKTLVDRLYPRPLEHAYFQGCSTGGRQALTAVQKYPLDFDGVIAGAPAIRASHLHAQQTWSASIDLDPENFDVLAEAAVAACDLADGVGDRVIENPLMCQPRAVVDVSGLPMAQARAALQAYSGPVVGRRSVFPGLAPGSESGWNSLLGDAPLSVAEQFYRYFVHKDPNWDYSTLDLETDVPMAERTVGDAMDAYDADISAFVENGGKLLLYHGWADPGISPYNTLNYFEAVTAETPDFVDSVRLFMLPGVAHCAGGEGPSSFDGLGTIDGWVSGGEAPHRIIASRVRGGEVDRTRPLCAYPAVAVYDGSGSTDAAENFTCR